MNDEHPIGEHGAMLSQLRHDVNDHSSRINALEKVSAAREEQVRALFQSVGEIKQICADIKSELGSRLEPLERSDGEKWKQAMGYVLAAIIAGAAGYLVGPR